MTGLAHTSIPIPHNHIRVFQAILVGAIGGVAVYDDNAVYRDCSPDRGQTKGDRGDAVSGGHEDIYLQHGSTLGTSAARASSEYPGRKNTRALFKMLAVISSTASRNYLT